MAGVPVVGEDVCQICERHIGPGEQVIQESFAGSVDDWGRTRYLWRHVACVEAASLAASTAHEAAAAIQAPPWAGLVYDPHEMARRLYELEQRVAALEARRR
jgi:hypothetical protein